MAVNGFAILTESLTNEIAEKINSWNGKFFSTGLYVKVERGAPIIVRKKIGIKWPNESIKGFDIPDHKIEGITFTWPHYRPSFWIDRLPVGDDAKIEDAIIEEINLQHIGVSDIRNLDQTILNSETNSIVRLSYSNLEHFNDNNAFTYYSNDTIKYLTYGRLNTQEKKDWLIFSGAKIDAGSGTTEEIGGEHFTLKVEAYSQLELAFLNPIYVQSGFIPWVDLVSSTYMFHDFSTMKHPGFQQKFINSNPKMRREEMNLNPNNSFGVPCPPDWIPDTA